MWVVGGGGGGGGMQPNPVTAIALAWQSLVNYLSNWSDYYEI